MHTDEPGDRSGVMAAPPGAAWPLVLVVLGPFAPEHRAPGLDPGALYQVDKDSFDDVLRRIAGEAPRLARVDRVEVSESTR